MARKLDDWITSYLIWTGYTEAPDIFHFWVGVSVIAAVLQRKVFFDMAYFRWRPNFYIILTAPSGIANKSTTIETGIELLRELSDVTIGAGKLTAQSIIDELREAQVARMLPDGTIEEECCLTFVASELGVLLDPNDRTLIDDFVYLWDGREKPFTKRTRKALIETAPNPWINLIGGITPEWLTENLPKSFIHGGFASRCAFVYADEKRRLVAYPTDLIERTIGSAGFRMQKTLLIEDLKQISTISGQYKISDEAKAAGYTWYEEMYERAIKNPELGAPDGFASRKQGHAHKLAMVLSASRGDGLVIEKDILLAAVDKVEELEKTLKKVTAKMQGGQNTRMLDEIMRQVRISGKIAQTQLFRLIFMQFGMGRDEFNKLCDSMIAAEMVRVRQEGNVVYIEER